MAITFRKGRHTIIPDREIVEILVDGEVGGIIYPNGEEGIKIVSAHITYTETDPDFAGTVVEDDGTKTWPPIPAVLIQFHRTPYTIEGNRIVRL